MAVVGEAKIIVKAVTRGVGPQIKAAMATIDSAASKDGDRIGNTLSKSLKGGLNKGGFFKGFKRGFSGGPEIDKLTKRLHHLQRGGMVAQSAIGTLAASLGSLIGGLGALVGAAGGAAGSVVALAGTFVALKIGTSLAGMALGGVTGPLKSVGNSASGTTKTIKELREEMQQLRFDAEEAALSEKEAALNLEKARENLARVQDLPPNSMARREAELSYEQADLALRRAIDRNNDLQDEIKNGPKQDSGAGTDPYAGLTKSQKAFAKLLVSLKPKFDALKEAVAKGFLPMLGNQINTLMTKNFAALNRMFTGIGEALGDATNSVGDFINSAKGMKNIEAIFKTSEGVIRSFGRILANSLDAFTTILRVADPLTQRFVGFLEAKTKTFQNFINAKAATGELEDFFTRAGDIAAGFGNVFGNIFSGLGKIVEANFGPGSGGDILLTWLQESTEKFANLDKMAGGKDKLAEYFVGAAENMKSMMQTLGGVIGILVRMGDMPEVKQFWDTMRGGLPALESILRSGAETAPILGTLLVNLTRIAAAFGDSGAIKAFLGVLSAVTGVVASFLELPFVKKILDFVGVLSGLALGVGTVLSIVTLLGTYLGGRFKAALGFIAGHPIIFTLMVIAGLFYLLYKNNKEFADSVNIAWAQIQTMLGGLMEQLGAMFTSLMPSITTMMDGIMGAIMELVPVLVNVIIPAFVQFLGAIMDIIPPIVASLIPVVESLMGVFTTLITSILPVISTLLEELVPPLLGIIEAVLPLIPVLLDALVPAFTHIMDIIVELLPVLSGIFVEAIKLVSSLLTDLTPVIVMLVGVIGDILIAITPLITSLLNALMPAFKTLMEAVVPLITTLVNALIPAITAIIDAVLPLITALIGFLMPVFQAIVNILTGFVIPIITWLADLFVNVLGVAISVLIGIITGLVGFFTNILMPAIGAVGDFFAGVFNGLRDIFVGVFNFLIGIFEGFVNFIIDGLNGFMGPLRDAINGILTTLGVDFQFSVIPNVRIPRLAKGGVVSPSAGGSLVNVAEAGKPERIEPLDENGMSKRDKAIMDMMGGGGINITVNPSPGMDETAVAEIVSRKLAFQMRKGANS